MDTDIKTLSQSIEKQLIKPTTDLTIDYSQELMEKLFDNEAIKHIPIVKTIFGIIKGTLAIREIHLITKMVTFFHQFHRGQIPESERQEFAKKLNTDVKYRDKVIQQILIMNDRYVESEKSAVHANLLLAHIHNKLAWDDYNDLLISLDTLHPKSLYHIGELGQSTTQFQTKDTDVAFEAALVGSGLATQRVSCYVITDLGRKLYYYGLRAEFDAEIPRVGDYDKRSPEEKMRSEMYSEQRSSYLRR